MLVGTLDYGPVRVVTGTMGYKHASADVDAVMASLATPNFLLKIIPHVDGSPRICELVEYYLEAVTLRGAWTGPAALSLTPHALAPVAELPVLEVVSSVHMVCDLTLGLGKVVHDYLQPSAAERRPTPSPASAGVSCHASQEQSRHRHRGGERHRQGDRHRPSCAKALAS